MNNLLPKDSLRPYEENNQDFNLGAIIDWPKLEELPNSFKIEPLSIKNQIADGNDDFCTSCAMAGSREPKEGVELYYPYLFAASKKEAGGSPDSWGLTLKDIGRGAVKYGLPETKDIPDEVKKLPSVQKRRFENYPASLEQLAYKHRAKTYFFLKKGPYDFYDSARAATWYFREKKQLLLFGVEFGWNLAEYELKGTPSGFGHAMYLVGFEKDGLLCVNSAGKNAGKNGVHKISRDTFNLYAKKFGMLMTVDIDRDEATTKVKSYEWNTASMWQKLIIILRSFLLWK